MGYEDGYSSKELINRLKEIAPIKKELLSFNSAAEYTAYLEGIEYAVEIMYYEVIKHGIVDIRDCSIKITEEQIRTIKEDIKKGV